MGASAQQARPAKGASTDAQSAAQECFAGKETNARVLYEFLTSRYYFDFKALLRIAQRLKSAFDVQHIIADFEDVQVPASYNEFLVFVRCVNNTLAAADVQRVLFESCAPAHFSVLLYCYFVGGCQRVSEMDRLLQQQSGLLQEMDANRFERVCVETLREML